MKNQKTFRVLTPMDIPQLRPPCMRTWDFINQRWMKPVHSAGCDGNCKHFGYHFEAWMNPPKKSIFKKLFNFINQLLP